MSSKSWRPRTGRGWLPATRTGGAARQSSWEAFGGDIWRDFAFYEGVIGMNCVWGSGHELAPRRKTMERTREDELSARLTGPASSRRSSSATSPPQNLHLSHSRRY